MAAKSAAKGDEKLLANVEGLIKELPKVGSVPAAGAESPSKQQQAIDLEKLTDEEEKAMLAKLSNIQWLIYPFKKMVLHYVKRIFGKKQSVKQE